MRDGNTDFVRDVRIAGRTKKDEGRHTRILKRITRMDVFTNYKLPTPNGF